MVNGDISSIDGPSPITPSTVKCAKNSPKWGCAGWDGLGCSWVPELSAGHYRWPIGWASFGRPQIRVREEHENNIAALTF